MKISILCIGLLCLFSCKISEEPEFKQINNIWVSSLSKDKITVDSDVIFYNSNDVGCKVIRTNIDAFVNDLNIGKVSQANSIVLLAKNEFKMPISFSFSPQQIFKDKKNILTSILGTILNKEIKINYSGIVTLSKAGINFDIDVNGTELIKIKQP
jgi:hypothetical protein